MKGWWSAVVLFQRKHFDKVDRGRILSGLHRIDIMTSPVIQWSRGSSRRGQLEHSRFWYQTFGKGRLAAPIFEEIRKWVRKNCKLTKTRDFYYTKRAAKFRSAGGRFSWP